MARVSSTAPAPPLTTTDLETLLGRITALEARGQAREERIGLLEEENRWLKAQLLGRSSEKTPGDELNPEQAWLFNEAEALAKAAEGAPVSVTIPAHERGKRGRKELSAELPRVDVVHDLPVDEKVCATDGTALGRIGEEISEQLDFKPAQAGAVGSRSSDQPCASRRSARGTVCAHHCEVPCLARSTGTER